METENELRQKKCPSCQATIDFHPEYLPWCDQCGWNLQPLKPAPPRTPLERFYASLGQIQTKQLHEAVSGSGSLRPVMTLTRALAYLIAMLAHLITAGLFVLGFWIIIDGLPKDLGVLSLFLGLIVLGMAWEMRPRFGKLPREGVLPLDAAPTIHRLVQEIAAALGAAPVDYIVIEPFFNASFGRASWRQKRVLSLGLPLFVSLDDQEKVALIGHELAHDVNGDTARGAVVGSAINSFISWYFLLRPFENLAPMSTGILRLPINLIYMLFASLLASPGWIGASTLFHLLLRDSQRAEYYADYLAATIGGTKAALGVLEKASLYNTFAIILQRAALIPELRDENMFEMLRERIANVPEREVERIRRVEQLEGSRLNVTHPPTAYRVNALHSRPVHEPAVIISAEDALALQAELARLEPVIQKKLIALRSAGYLA